MTMNPLGCTTLPLDCFYYRIVSQHIGYMFVQPFFLYWVYHTTMKIAMNHYQSLVITITPRKNAIPKHQRTRLWRPWSILICAALRQGWKGCPCPQLGGVSMNRTCTIYIYVYICTHTHKMYIHTYHIYICIHNIYLLFVTLIQKQMSNI